MKKTLLKAIITGAVVLTMGTSALASECIAPAKPGGGFDLTCRIASTGLKQAGLLDKPMKVIYMPGGIGAVAYNHMNSVKRDAKDTIVALSSGSALNIAQGKFGKNLTANDARWLAAAGADFGLIAVRADSEYKTLNDLVKAIKSGRKIVVGAGGSVGSQDWMKAALLYKAAAVSPKNMRYVAYEGGGESIAALLGGHIAVYPGDVSEISSLLESGKVRVLAVLSSNRLPAPYANYPTAKELGYDVEWTIFRGFYMGKDVSDENYNKWVDIFNKAYKNDKFKAVREAKGLYPFEMAGAEFDAYVKAKVKAMRALAVEAGLIK